MTVINNKPYSYPFYNILTCIYIKNTCIRLYLPCYHWFIWMSALNQFKPVQELNRTVLNWFVFFPEPNRTISSGSVLSSKNMLKEPNRTEPWRHYFKGFVWLCICQGTTIFISRSRGFPPWPRLGLSIQPCKDRSAPCNMSDRFLPYGLRVG